MDRRDFCRKAPALSAGIALGAATLPLSACAGMTYLTPRGSALELVVAAADVPASGAMVQRPDMERPVYLRPDGDGGYTALLARCTHRGCQPDAVADRLVCPCHGSEFDLQGRVLEGPADQPLTRYAVRLEGTDLVVSMTGRAR